MSFLRLVQLKRGLMARLVALGLMPGEPAVVWDDDSKPRLLIGDRGGIPRELQPGQHTHPDADLDGISWIKVTQVPATFPPAVHVHVIGDVTGLQVALDGKAALGHTHDFSAVYAPLNHTHAWSQLTGVPATFTPPMASGVTLGGIKVGGGLAIDAQGVLSTTYTYSLPIASGTTLGGVKAGAGVSIDAGGALSVTYAATAGSANAVAYTNVTGKPSTLSGYGITDAQGYSSDLAAIAGLAGTTGLLRKTAAGAWSLDTAAYITSSASITGSAAKWTTARTITLGGGFSGSVSLDGSANVSLNGGLVARDITASTDLNSYTAPGFYKCPASATAATLTNSPTAVAFGMMIGYASGYTQFLWEYATASTAKYWVRHYYNTVWGPWTRILKEDATSYGISITGTAGSAPASDVYAWAKATTKPSYSYAEVGAPSTTGTNASGSWGISITGSSASCTGNAATASTLQTARTINGVSFNGSANITIYDSTKLPLSGGAITGDIVAGSAGRDDGMFGTYDSTKTQHIWSIGISYRNAADGSSFGNLYGLAYKYNGSAGGHGVYLVNNGVALCGMGTNLWTSGNVSGYSDERLKTNWQSLPAGFVARLAGVKSGTYDRIDRELSQVGVSAQSLRTVMPLAVIGDEDGILSVAYGNAALAAAVELAKESVAQKAEIAELRQMVTTLAAKVGA